MHSWFWLYTFFKAYASSNVFMDLHKCTVLLVNYGSNMYLIMSKKDITVLYHGTFSLQDESNHILSRSTQSNTFELVFSRCYFLFYWHVQRQSLEIWPCFTNFLRPCLYQLLVEIYLWVEGIISKFQKVRWSILCLWNSLHIAFA